MKLSNISHIKKRLMLNKEFAALYSYKEPMDNFIDQILLLRAKYNLTQKRLAKIINISAEDIEEIESGYRDITYAEMVKISKAFGKKLIIEMR